MWLPMWIVCLGISCQGLELVIPELYKTKEECEKVAKDTAREFLREYDRVGYKCVKTERI